MAKSSFAAEVTFNHPMIYQKCDAMTNISTQDIVHFYIISSESLLIKTTNLAK